MLFSIRRVLSISTVAPPLILVVQYDRAAVTANVLWECRTCSPPAPSHLRCPVARSEVVSVFLVLEKVHRGIVRLVAGVEHMSSKCFKCSCGISGGTRIIVKSVERNGEVDALRLQAQCWMKQIADTALQGCCLPRRRFRCCFDGRSMVGMFVSNTSYPALDDQAVRSTDRRTGTRFLVMNHG